MKSDSEFSRCNLRVTFEGGKSYAELLLSPCSWEINLEKVGEQPERFKIRRPRSLAFQKISKICTGSSLYGWARHLSRATEAMGLKASK